MTGHTFRQIDEQWDQPRLEAWNRLMGGMPPLAVMVGSYIGYKPPEGGKGASGRRETLEEAGARIMKGFGAM
jgi:hypothetical protein